MNVTQVYYSLRQLASAMVSGGLSMQPSYDVEEFDRKVTECEDSLRHGTWMDNPDVNRTLKLSRHPSNTGHANVLSGMQVSFNVTATNAWMLQAERYHFLQLVTSQSKMHRIEAMVSSGDRQSKFHPMVSRELIDWYVKWQEGKTLEEKIYNCPIGLELTFSMATNYLQLRTVYLQRKSHKLQEWRDFCSIIAASLPLGKELIAGDLTEVEKFL